MVRRYAVSGNSLWSAFNPSIMQALNGDYWIAFRSSNYKFTDGRDVILTHGRKVRNRIFIGKLDPITWLIDERTVKELEFSGLRFFDRGPEDPRLYWDGKNYCLSMTVLEQDVPIAKIGVFCLKSLEDPVVTSFNLIPSPDEKRVEKNWMPIHKIGKLSRSKTDFMYSPSTVLSKGSFVPTGLGSDFDSFRGGSQIIPLGDGTNIALIHEIYDKHSPVPFSMSTFSTTRNMRYYSHRFVRMDEKFTIFQASKPFFFLEEGIEFAAGIAATEDGFVISYGRFDVACYIATISLGHALISMKDLTD